MNSVSAFNGSIGFGKEICEEICGDAMESSKIFGIDFHFDGEMNIGVGGC